MAPQKHAKDGVPLILVQTFFPNVAKIAFASTTESPLQTPAADAVAAEAPI